ncbi:MAG: NAD(P)-dependent oxidoreductase [Burkholderiaceae bacterium]
MNRPGPARVVVLDPIAESTADRLRALLPAGFELACATARGDAHLMQLIADADFAIAGQVPVSADVLRAGTRLRLLHKWGVGVDNIDVAAARSLGIMVARTSGSNAQPVAEFTLGLMLAALRNLAFGHAELQKGCWRGSALPAEPLLLSGKTVGLVGLGAIGQRVARLLRGFDCQVLYYKRTPLPAGEQTSLGVAYRPLAELLAQADVVSLHCPLTDDTRGLIDRPRWPR